MENKNEVNLGNKKKCGASVEEAVAAVNSLSKEERAELLKILLSKYGMEVPRKNMSA